jgi:hypothetical protein
LPGARWLREQLIAINAVDDDDSFSRTLSLNNEASAEKQATVMQTCARARTPLVVQRVARSRTVPLNYALASTTSTHATTTWMPERGPPSAARALANQDRILNPSSAHLSPNRVVLAESLPPSTLANLSVNLDAHAPPNWLEQEIEARRRANMARKRAADSVAVAWQV